MRTVIYCLRMQRQAERLGELHRSITKSHLQTKNTKTSREDQEDFTEALRTTTYKLRVQRQAEKVQENFTEALRTATHSLRMQRQAEKIRRTSQKH